jgi:hypothetical protein
MLKFSAVGILSGLLSEKVVTVVLAVYPDIHVLAAHEVVPVRHQGITILDVRFVSLAPVYCLANTGQESGVSSSDRRQHLCRGTPRWVPLAEIGARSMRGQAQGPAPTVAGSVFMKQTSRLR